MSITLTVGRESQTAVPDLFGNSVLFGVRKDGAVLIQVLPDGKNSDNSGAPLEQEIVIAFTPEQTAQLAKEILRLQPSA